MRSFVLTVALVALALSAVTVQAKKPEKACQAVNKKGGIPGGWSYLTKADVQANGALLQAAMDKAVAIGTANIPNYAASGCIVTKTDVKKACLQVVNGVNFEYEAHAHYKCPAALKKKAYSEKYIGTLYQAVGK